MMILKIKRPSRYLQPKVLKNDFALLLKKIFLIGCLGLNSAFTRFEIFRATIFRVFGFYLDYRLSKIMMSKKKEREKSRKVKKYRFLKQTEYMNTF
jgi:hypothetical protein